MNSPLAVHIDSLKRNGTRWLFAKQMGLLRGDLFPFGEGPHEPSKRKGETVLVTCSRWSMVRPYLTNPPEVTSKILAEGGFTRKHSCVTCHFFVLVGARQ